MLEIVIAWSESLKFRGKFLKLIAIFLEHENLKGMKMKCRKPIGIAITVDENLVARQKTKTRHPKVEKKQGSVVLLQNW